MFTVSRLPHKAREWFNKEPVFWPSAVSAAIEGGLTNVDDLTNIVFFMHHKERLRNGVGKPLNPAERNFKKLAAEWKGMRKLVTPLVKGKGKAKTIPILKSNNIRTVGAWCGSATLARPERDVDFALQHNINRLDIVVNDHAAARSPRTFTVRNVKKIRALCQRARDNSIEVHLMSWIMPHRAYIDRAAEVLVPLCDDVGASGLQWDAEEPWTRAKNRMRYSDAADRIADKFSALTCEMGVTAIGFTPTSKVGPLVSICDYTVPQAYSTAKSGVKPGSGQERLHARYNSKFGKPIVMGLAAFRQKGIPRHTVESAMTACINATNDLGCDTVMYWSLRWIRSNKAVREVISSIRG